MKKRIVTVLAILAAAACVAAGIEQGQTREVLMKATHVCLECIGIG